MKLMEALKQRRAVREYLPDPVDPAVLAELVEAACLAPSHMNTQPWSFVVVSEPAAVARLGHGATEALRRSGHGAKWEHETTADALGAEFNLFYRAPALVVVCATQTGGMAEMDCAMAAHSLMLAAKNAGLGSCWVGSAQPWLASREGREALGLDADERPVAPIVIGAPAGEPLSPGRLKPEVRWIRQ